MRRLPPKRNSSSESSDPILPKGLFDKIATLNPATARPEGGAGLPPRSHGHSIAVVDGWRRRVGIAGATVINRRWRVITVAIVGRGRSAEAEPNDPAGDCRADGGSAASVVVGTAVPAATATMPIGGMDGRGQRQSRAKGGSGQNTCIHGVIRFVVTFLLTNHHGRRTVPHDRS